MSGHRTKRTRWIVLGVIAVVVLGGFLSLNKIVERGIETASTDALGVETSVQTVRLGLLSGRFGVEAVKVHNPEAFDEGSLLLLGEGRMSVGIESILSDTVRVDEFVLRGIDLDLALEDGSSNVRPVLDRLRNREGGGEPGAKRLVIDELRIEDVRVHVSAKSAALSIDEDLTFETPPIRLTGVGAGDGATIEQIASLVLTRVVHAATESDQLPEGLRALLAQDVETLVAEQRDLLEEKARDALEDAGKNALDEAADAVEDVIGG